MRRKKKIGIKKILTALVFIAAAAAACAAAIYLSPSTKEAGWRAYHLLTRNRLYMVFIDEIIEEESAKLVEGELYLEAGFVKKYIDEKLFIELPSGAVTITTYDTVRRLYAGDGFMYVNRVREPVKSIVRIIDEKAWIPADMISELYEYTVRHYETTGLVIVDDDHSGRAKATLKVKKAALRAEPDPKAVILGYAEQGDILSVFDKENSYFKARLYDGRTGYIAAKNLKTAEAFTPLPPAKTYAKFETGLGSRVTVLWDQFFSVESAANEELRYLKGDITVLAPTWFSFKEDYSGELINWADRTYTDWAHENNCKVWALISDNFDSRATSAVLADTTKRDQVIDQLLMFADLYGFDGINVDFEMVRLTDVEYYIEFLRELAPLAHGAGLAVSVDMYVPKSYNMYYNREAVSEVCDYIIIMGYDEHFRGDTAEGPVASIGFVEDGIQKTLEEAPRGKVILGVPLYNRVWTRTLTPQGEKLTAADYGMSAPREDFAAHGAGFMWDEATKTYYGQYEGEDEEGNLYTRMVWLEDETSLDEKLKLADKYELAGIAGWKRRLETDEVWVMFEKWKNGG